MRTVNTTKDFSSNTCTMCDQAKYTKFYGKRTGKPVCRNCYMKNARLKRTGSVKQKPKTYDWGW